MRISMRHSWYTYLFDAHFGDDHASRRQRMRPSVNDHCPDDARALGGRAAVVGNGFFGKTPTLILPSTADCISTVRKALKAVRAVEYFAFPVFVFAVRVSSHET